MKWVFVVNSIAGKGKAQKVSEKIENYCRKNNVDFEMRYTRCPGEGTLITKEYKKEKCVIFAVGGDGTVNEVLNGIVGSKNILGVVPAGSGNDFYKTLLEIEENFPVFDVGKINDMYFINTVCFGLDAEVANNIDLMKLKGVPKSQLYYASILYTFSKYKFKDISFKLNKTKMSGKFTIVTICNGRYYGNGFNIAPNASYCDGLFDIYFVDKMSKPRMIPLILKLKKGEHEKSPLVNNKQDNTIYVKSEVDLVCNVDGEKLLEKEFKIKLIPKEVTVYNNKKVIKEML